MRGYMRAVIKELWETVHNQATSSLFPHKLASEGPHKRMAEGLTKYVFVVGEVLRGVGGVHGHGHTLFLNLFLEGIDPCLIILKRKQETD